MCRFRNNSPKQPDQLNALSPRTPIVVPCPGLGPVRARGWVPGRRQTKKSAGITVIPADYSVELRGLEPLTPCMPCRCATSCATAPNNCCPFELFRLSPKQLKYLRTAIPKIPNRAYSARFRGFIRSRTLRWLWLTRRLRAAGPPRGSPSRGVPGRRTRGPPRAGRG